MRWTTPPNLQPTCQVDEIHRVVPGWFTDCTAWSGFRSVGAILIRFGPAGWDDKDWAGIVYPRENPKGFDRPECLARYLDTIEINSTFYGPAASSTARRWTGRVAGSPIFRFTTKFWRRFTHQRKEA
jgi:hypothetical protein